MVSKYKGMTYRMNKGSDIFERKTRQIMAKSYHFQSFLVKKKTDVAFKPSGERSNPTKRFDPHLNADKISDGSPTRNTSSLLHDKLYEVRIDNIPLKDTGDLYGILA